MSLFKSESNATIGLFNHIDSARKVSVSDYVSVPTLLVTSSKISLFRYNTTNSIKKPVLEKCLANLTREKNLGVISKATSAYIARVLDIWISSIVYNNRYYDRINKRKNHFPVFVTLTLPSTQHHSDNHIKRHLLGTFIKRIIYNQNTQLYFWRAEAQNNGNIHFHLILDTYFSHRLVRETWNSILSENGYVEDFFLKHGHRNPNSTDIKGIDSVDNFIKYVLKYVLKKENKRPITGRLWGMSDKLRELKSLYLDCDSRTYDEFEQMCSDTDNKIFKGEHGTVIYFKKELFNLNYRNYVQKKFQNYCEQTYRQLYGERSISQVNIRGNDYDDVVSGILNMGGSYSQQELFTVNCIKPNSFDN